MKTIDLPLAGLKLFEPTAHRDERGHFIELYHAQRYPAAGLHATFVQDNFVFSRRNVLRGMHYQYPEWQGKLVQVLNGEIFDVAVDVRPDSATFGQWYGVTLSGEKLQQLYMPDGFAHGYCVLSETAQVLFKTTTFYRADQVQTLRWDDPAIGIAWPISAPIMAAADRAGKTLATLVAATTATDTAT